MKRLLYILLLAGILMSCGSDDEGYIENDDTQYESVDDNSEGENEQEDNKNKAYRLGNVTLHSFPTRRSSDHRKSVV